MALALGTGKPIRDRYMCVIGTTSDDCHTCRRLSLLGIAHPITGPPFQVQEVYRETVLR